MRAEVTSALGRYLLTVADDELILGYRDSEWTGIAPLVEEDVAFSSLAQDEIGHARLYYMLAADLLESDADHLALGRGPDDYYHATVLETRTTPKYDASGAHRGGGDWARAVARRFLYDLFDDLRTDALVSSSYAPLAGAVQKIRREEQYHLRHGAAWWRALASAEGEARERLEGALLALWPGLLGLFEDAPGEDLLMAEGLLSRRTSDLRDAWLERVQDHCAAVGIRFPAERTAAGWSIAVSPEAGGRQGRHGPAWAELYDEMTMVRRLEPEAVW
ncbi:1,2-phenylacetyl-CoA epoxidase subunit PaaC [Sphaerobacter thermophilus]|jgi:ring-1,2-phenylacetyl-CoA epoxidase subunit PaaC|uniref:1,2-phenylacetyl-CoA epoxidase subunit PaaC n=1 Tax=Sphaerobacter thermophilus TaxID=2057 RepID=UPI0039C43914